MCYYRRYIHIVVTFGVPKAEIIPIEPDTVNTGEGKCKNVYDTETIGPSVSG